MRGPFVSDRANVQRFLALLTGRDVELDELALFETLVAIALNVGEMYKHVITLLARDEAESLFCIEKLHCTLCHEYSILWATDQPIRSARYHRLYSSPAKASAFSPDDVLLAHFDASHVISDVLVVHQGRPG